MEEFISELFLWTTRHCLTHLKIFLYHSCMFVSSDQISHSLGLFRIIDICRSCSPIVFTQQTSEGRQWWAYNWHFLVEDAKMFYGSVICQLSQGWSLESPNLVLVFFCHLPESSSLVAYTVVLLVQFWHWEAVSEPQISSSQSMVPAAASPASPGNC